jgi:hypothetical protein
MFIHKLNFTSKSIYVFGAIIALSFLFGYFIPGEIAKKENVYFEKDLKEKFFKIEVYTLKEQRGQLKSYDNQVKALDSIITAIDKRLAKDTVHYKFNIELLKYYNAKKSLLEKPIALRPFYLNQLMFFWAFIFLTLSFIVFLISPVKLSELRNKKYIALVSKVFIILYPVYRFPSWIRNLPEGQMDAKSIYFANLNFAPFSFYYQEFEALITTVLLSLIVGQYVKLYYRKKIEFDTCPKNYFERIFDFDYLDSLAGSFINLQIASVFLLPTFIWYATYYWNNVILNHDNRYILPAIIVHSIIILVWAIVSLPTLITWYDFNRKKLEAKKNLHTSTTISMEEKKFYIEQIENLKPISFWNITVSAATIIFTFIFPLLRILK